MGSQGNLRGRVVIERVFGLQSTGVPLHQRFEIFAQQAAQAARIHEAQRKAEIRALSINEVIINHLVRMQVARRSRPYIRRGGDRSNNATGQQRGRSPQSGHSQQRSQSQQRSRSQHRDNSQNREDTLFSNPIQPQERKQLAGRGMPALRGRGTGRGGVSRPLPVSKEQLDRELDDYMSRSRAVLDKQLDEYMDQYDKISCLID